jgi:hypothetical protein
MDTMTPNPNLNHKIIAHSLTNFSLPRISCRSPNFPSNPFYILQLGSFSSTPRLKHTTLLSKNVLHHHPNTLATNLPLPRPPHPHIYPPSRHRPWRHSNHPRRGILEPPPRHPMPLPQSHILPCPRPPHHIRFLQRRHALEFRLSIR